MSSARKINYIITQVTPVILFAIFHRYTDIATTKTSFVIIFRHDKTMPLKTSRLITLSFSLSLSLPLFFQTNRARQNIKEGSRGRTAAITYHFVCINDRQWYRRRPTEFWVNLAPTAELTESTMSASAIYCESIALTRSLWRPRAFARPRQTIPSNKD